MRGPGRVAASGTVDVVITDPSKLSSALLAATILALACGGAQPTAPAETAPAEAEPAAEAKTGTPKAAVDEPVFDFGGIALKDSVDHVFVIRNVGDGDLKIERVQKT
jgi:hypothetical protein